MGKSATPRALASNEAMATLRTVRISPRKLGLVAGLIRGKRAQDALVQLQFSTKGIAPEVEKLLKSAIANAENNHNLNVDKLVIREVRVGKSLVMKRVQSRARGRASRIEKPFSNISIIVHEPAEVQ